MSATHRPCHVAAALFLLMAASANATDPQEVRIGPNERVVHIVGSPFMHVYARPYLQEHLVRRFAHRGLVIRQVPMRQTIMALRSLDQEVLVHKPTLVVYQPGSTEISAQSRRRVYDFAGYPKVLESLVKKLRDKGARVIVCSVIPKGKSESIDKLAPPNDGLKTWADAARQIAKRHGATYVDQFTGAVTWPMISGAKTYYATAQHNKSWALFTSQVRFVMDVPSVRIDAAKAKADCQGATVADLKAGKDAAAFTLQSTASAGPLMLSVPSLAEGRYAISVDGKPWLTRTAAELATGVDLGPKLTPVTPLQELDKALRSGVKVASAAAVVQTYKLPAWLKLADFQEQKQAELARVEARLSEHDAKLRQMVQARPLRLAIRPAAK